MPVIGCLRLQFQVLVLVSNRMSSEQLLNSDWVFHFSMRLFHVLRSAVVTARLVQSKWTCLEITLPAVTMVTHLFFATTTSETFLVTRPELLVWQLSSSKRRTRLMAQRPSPETLPSNSIIVALRLQLLTSPSLIPCRKNLNGGGRCGS